MAPGNLRLGSSLIALGLSWKAALGLIALGHFSIALAITANGLVGAKYGIGYPVQSRAPFGFYFSYVMVVIRMVTVSSGMASIHTQGLSVSMLSSSQSGPRLPQ